MSVKAHAKICVLGLMSIIKVNGHVGLCGEKKVEVGISKIIWSLRGLAYFCNAVKSKDLGFRLPGFEPWFCHLLHELSLLICRMGTPSLPESWCTAPPTL